MCGLIFPNPITIFHLFCTYLHLINLIIDHIIELIRARGREKKLLLSTIDIELDYFDDKTFCTRQATKVG